MTRTRESSHHCKVSGQHGSVRVVVKSVTEKESRLKRIRQVSTNCGDEIESTAAWSAVTLTCRITSGSSGFPLFNQTKEYYLTISQVMEMKYILLKCVWHFPSFTSSIRRTNPERHRYMLKNDGNRLLNVAISPCWGGTPSHVPLALMQRNNTVVLSPNTEVLN
jgi:hypothetical protein